MTAPHQPVLRHLSEEFAAMSQQMARVASQFTELERVLTVEANAPVPAAQQPVQAPQPQPQPQPPAPVHAGPPPGYQAQPPWMPTPPPPPPMFAPPAPPRTPKPPRPTLAARLNGDTEQGWIGKILAVAGVGVTLIGVVLLLVLAAQAGILRPEMRVGAGAVLAGALVVVGVRLNRRPGGRVGGIALAATGIAAAYMDVIAVTTIYHWTTPVAGLLLASVIGAAGLTLSRRWDSEHLALLVLVPLIVLGPVITDGITLLLIGFMIALSAATLPMQLGKDWIWMHTARTAAVSFPLLMALLLAAFDNGDDRWLLGGACGIAALLAIFGAVILLPGTSRRTAVALLTVAGVLPALSAGVAVDRVLASLLAAAVATGTLALVLMVGRLPGVHGVVAAIFSALSAVATLIAVTVAFEGDVAGPVLLGLALTTAVAGRHHLMARWAAMSFATIGGLLYLAYAPPEALVRAMHLAPPVAISTLVASVLTIACAIAIARTWTGARAADDDSARLLWAAAAAVVVYAVTMFTVTAGVLVGGTDGGFLAGHMAATICWIAMAAALFVVALRLHDRDARTAPIVGGLALTAAAMAKLFLFDLGTLDGMFRVAAFIIVGLVLLGMGAGYARSLAQQDLAGPRLMPSQRYAWPIVMDLTAASAIRLVPASVEPHMSTSTPINSRRRNASEVVGFVPSTAFIGHLQSVLVDLIELHLQGKQAHWNVVGTNFRDLHLQLDELVDFARVGSDTIAERMRALDGAADGRSDTVAATTTLPQFPPFEHNTAEVVDLITTRIQAAVETMRAVHDAIDAEDASTADILHQLIDGLEKLAWLIKSENRKV